MNKHLFAVVIALLVTTLACQLGGEASTQAPAPTYTPYPTYTPLPVPTEAAPQTEPPTEAPEEDDSSTPVLATRDPNAVGDYYIHIVNNLKQPVCRVYIHLADSDEWGENRLEGILKSGEEVVIYHSVDEFIIFTLDCNNNLLNVREIPGESEGMLWVLNPSVPKEDGAIEDELLLEGDAHFIFLVNELDTNICELFISPIASAYWGSNLLDDVQVAPGEDYTIFHPYVEIDTQVRDCEGQVVDEVKGKIYDSDGWRWKIKD